MSNPIVKIFISSPSDVRPERLIAERVINRLDREFTNFFHVQPVLWEREPLVASHHFQEKIIPPSETEIVVVIIWSRLGVPLPSDKFSGPLSESTVTGTEWEFEDALNSKRKNNKPEILVFKKIAPITVSIEDEENFQELKNNKLKVNLFFEKWFFDTSSNSFSAAFREFDSVTDFEEMLEIHLRKLLTKIVNASISDNNNHIIRWHKGCPFRGLLSFNLEYSQVYFGRNKARNDLRELLNAQIEKNNNFLMVIGASGSGKSSLVLSGFLSDVSMPGMIDKVGLLRHAIFTPSSGTGDLLDKLVNAFVSDSCLPELISEMDLNCDLIKNLILNNQQHTNWTLNQALNVISTKQKLTDGANSRILVIIDQFEEIFTNKNITDEDRKNFIDILSYFSKSGIIWIICIMRSDFFDRIESLSVLANLTATSRYLLPPLESKEFKQIIEKPSFEAGFTYEYDSNANINLSEVIQQCALRERNSLPLLSFLLEQLWINRSEDNVLTFSAYNKLGGLEGAIGIRAEQVFLDLSPQIQSELLGLCRSLVSISFDGKITSRWANWEDINVNESRVKLVEEFLKPDSRLLVIDHAENKVKVRVTHEALLSYWERVKVLLEKEKRDLELRQLLEQSAKKWETTTKSNEVSLLLNVGQPLNEALDLKKRWENELPSLITVYIEASLKESKKKLRKKIQNLLAFFSLIPVLAVLVWSTSTLIGVRSLEKDLKFTTIPSGCFLMGSNYEKDTFDKPIHKVCLNTFNLGTYLITRDNWRQVMLLNSDPSTHKERGNLPVETISWEDVKFFIKLLNIFGNSNYRLPTEAEFEYAERANTTTIRYWGDDINQGCLHENISSLEFKKENTDQITANCSDGYLFSSPVGSFPPNPFGVYDILGNVWEFSEDCWNENFIGAPNDGSAWLAGDCSQRVQKGGGFDGTAGIIRSADRYRVKTNYRSHTQGFRIVKEKD